MGVVKISNIAIIEVGFKQRINRSKSSDSWLVSLYSDMRLL